jgi:hypothetical protein
LRICGKHGLLAVCFFVGLKSTKTIVDWRSYFRCICASVIEDSGHELIGGPGLTVEVDETLLFKRKSNTGRLLSNEATQTWLFGGLCRETGRAFLARVERRDARTLLEAIRANIHPESRIISDCWRGYLSLSQEGFSHGSVNHSFNFVDPNDPSINTQRIERMWRTLKSIIPAGASAETRWTYLAEFIFKQRTNWFSMSIGSRLELLLHHVKSINIS